MPVLTPLLRRFSHCLLLITVLGAPLFNAAAQETQGAQQTVPGLIPTNTEPPDASTRHMMEDMAQRRNAVRQKEIVSDTAKLLDLAQKLNNDVSKSDKNTLSLSVLKDADEIEKLAHAIKDKMRNGE